MDRHRNGLELRQRGREMVGVPLQHLLALLRGRAQRVSDHARRRKVAVLRREHEVLVALDGRRSILGSHLNFGEGERGWDFVSPGHGDVDFESLLRALNRIGYDGPLSIEWEDSGMEREWGVQDAIAFVRRSDFERSTFVFDEAMRSGA
jgi:hypothetical protein